MNNGMGGEIDYMEQEEEWEREGLLGELSCFFIFESIG